MKTPMYKRGSYKRNPNRIIKDIKFFMVFNEPQITKLKELAELRGVNNPEVIRQLVEEEHLRQYREL